MSNKSLGTAFEQRVVDRARAKGLRAARQPGSGVFRDHPHDVVLDKVLGECKVRSTEVTMKGERHVTLDLNWLRRVQKDALASGFIQGVLVFNPKGSASPVALMDLDFFLDLLHQFVIRT